jgi:hypothetical protein
MFANNYLTKNNREPLIKAAPNADCTTRIVIPCYLEPDILLTLESLNSCDLPQSKVEVIVLVNHSEVAADEIKKFNINTKVAVENWISENNNSQIDFFVIGPVELQKKWAGVGLARKSGMDEAVLRFNDSNKTDGIIVSLDADTLVAKSYLVEIEKHFKQNPKNVGATISFQHQTEGLEKAQLEGIMLYEKFLEYYKNAVSFTGYPYSMFTIGSAFAVTADAYVKRGGMNRRQAGEDFYFLQNLVQIGKVGEITSTMVFPSARLSDRVPFGTGNAMQKWMKGEEDLNKTYNIQAFVDLKTFFDLKETLFKIDEKGFNKLIHNLPGPVIQFILEDNFWPEVNELNRNCSALNSFQLRFYQKFNAFKIMKFLNFAHEKFYSKADLFDQIATLNQQMGNNETN